MADNSPFLAVPDGVLVRIRLTPKAGRNGCAGLKSDAEGRAWLDIRITAVPEKGKANAALLKYLAKTWHCPSGALEIRNGQTDRNKQIFVRGDTSALLARLKEWLKGTGQ